VGEVAAREIAAFLRQPSSQAVIDGLLRHGVTVVPHRPRTEAPLAGRSVVFTGALETMTRAEAERLVERSGGRPMHTVTRGTDLVVAGSGAGSKLDRARALHLPVVSERAFLRRFPSLRRPLNRAQSAMGSPEASATTTSGAHGNAVATLAMLKRT
jgi:DNA ligase (NAD+)